jgi:competence protein ComEC
VRMEASSLKRRCPAFVAALALAGGILCSHLWPVSAGLWLSVALASWGTACALLWWRRRPGWISAMLWIGVVAIGGLRHHQHTRLLPADHVGRGIAYGARGELSGRLLGDPEWRPDGRRRVRLALESLRPESEEHLIPLSGDLLLTIGEEVSTFEADAADRVRLRCRVLEPQPARNPGAFDYRRFLALRHGVHATASIYRDSDVLDIRPEPESWWARRLTGPLRDSMRTSLTAHLGGPQSALLVGMLIGEKHAIPDEVASRFRATGLAHALVISGLHVGLVALFLLTLLKVLRLPDPVACCVTVVLLVVYAMVTQLQAPVVRASVMASIVLIGRAVELPGSVLNSLGLAALVLMVAQPTSVLTLSFQLSFAATLSIITLYPPLITLIPARWSEGTSWVGTCISMPATVSLAAQLGTAPLILHHFGQVAPISLLANLLVVPLLGIAVAQGLLLVLVAPILPAVGTLVSGACWLTLTALLRIVELFAVVPAWKVAQPSPTMTSVMVGLICLVTFAIYLPVLRRLTLVLALVGANVWVWGKASAADELEVLFLDVGQGDAAFVRFPNGKTMVVDGGIRSRRIDMGERVVVPWLRRQGIHEIDLVLASHPHADHIGGLVHLLEEMPVRHFIDGGQQYDSWTSRRLHELIEVRGVTYHTVRAGDSLAGLGGVGGLVLHPTPAFVDDGHSLMGLNDGSVVLRLDYGGRRLLFTGDIEHDTDASMLAWGQRLQADVLKVAHHGSSTSSGRAFVDGVDPVLAVISVGAHNKFRHPSTLVTKRLAARTTLMRTDRDGAVWLRLNRQGRMTVGSQLTVVPSRRVE